MPNVAEIIRDHVSLEVNCVDRLYLNGYVPRLQSEGGVVGFLLHARGQKISSPAVFEQITDAFKTDTSSTRTGARASSRSAATPPTP
jgi:hypothetical protein